VFSLNLTVPINATLADGSATGTILNDDAEPNRACNGTFEAPKNLTLWTKVGSGTQLSLGPGRTGANAMQVYSSSESKFGIDDKPDCINPTEGKNVFYQISAWVRALNTSTRGSVTIEVKEYVGSSSQGSVASIKVPLTTSWQPVTLDYKVKSNSSYLSIQILNSLRDDRETFLIDDYSIVKLPDRPPVVTSPPVVNAFVGIPVQFTVTAQDPDGHAITSLTHTGAPGSTFTPNPARTSGTFSWTPGATGSYPLVFSALANALTGKDSTEILVNPMPANLCQNGTFEQDTSRWIPYGSAELSRFSPGRTGSYALKVQGKSSSSFGVDDKPDNITGAIKNDLYLISAFVRSVSHTGKARIRIYEYRNGNQQGSTFYSPESTLSTSWKQLSAVYKIRTSGSTLSIRITDETGRQTFLIDDVYMGRIGTAALLAAATEGEEPREAESPAEGPRARRAFMDADGALRLESLPAEMEEHIPAVVLRYGGREVQALADRTMLGEDQDANGREEMAARFDPTALTDLFAGLVTESQDVEVVLEARSRGSQVAGAPLTLHAAGAPLVYAASFAPNPARSAGVLSFTLPRPGPARILLFDTAGRRVRTLMDSESVEAGSHRIPLERGGVHPLPSGLYYYRVETREGTLRGRFVFLQ
jgi:hypothetical protein